MKRKLLVIGAVAAGLLAVGTIGYASSVRAQPYGGGGMGGGYGPGMMQGYGPSMGYGPHGYGPGRGYGPGMMGGYGPGYGPGMMQGYGQGYGPGMMQGYQQGYGPGMMQGYGPGYGPGMRGGYGPGYGQGAPQGNLNLSTDDVKANLQRWIDAQGNPRIKVGAVKEKDADTIEADIVTKDNSLVQRFTVNRHTGFYRPSEN